MPEVNGTLGRPRRRWDENIKMDFEWVVKVIPGIKLFRTRPNSGLLITR
jgi:hypothetical protein